MQQKPNVSVDKTNSSDGRCENAILNKTKGNSQQPGCSTPNTKTHKHILSTPPPPPPSLMDVKKSDVTGTSISQRNCQRTKYRDFPSIRF